MWRDINQADVIHKSQLDKEHGALSDLAKSGRGRIANALASQFGTPEARPSEEFVATLFSAAIEFLESSMSKVSTGANTRKNDPGLYVDFQLLFYLGDKNLTFLTKENFEHEIRKSPQRLRIVTLMHCRSAAPLGLDLYSCVPRPHGLGPIISCPLRGTLLSCNHAAAKADVILPGTARLKPVP